MIGRSHGIHAEPISFGLKLALMFDEFSRATQRLSQMRERIRVGKISGAVGTHAHLDPRVEKSVCERLGLRPAALSTQIIQRDRHAEFMTVLALIACSIDRWATEFRHLQRTEVLEVEEYFAAGQKGSSAMPHKRNPITGERLCGIARVIRGNVAAALENVALWHERDISHSSVERIILPDSCSLVDYMLVTLRKLVEGVAGLSREHEAKHGDHSRPVCEPVSAADAHREGSRSQRRIRSRSARRHENLERWRDLCRALGRRTDRGQTLNRAGHCPGLLARKALSPHRRQISSRRNCWLIPATPAPRIPHLPSRESLCGAQFLDNRGQVNGLGVLVAPLRDLTFFNDAKPVAFEHFRSATRLEGHHLSKDSFFTL